ncbi:hypothetical protein GCM10009715_18360 [Paeniglutamicibacter psychrophenolicus]|uniref:Y4mF family transcriptional regulator n=1 Tax=Paeniglutamicibacter psychrophenolicus TaxID=257454 RepID=A0ABS4WD54_9MICC|nr:helix-turn-helix domain-containing protein [Paeniglutamicibacter psychrophenolicus]MBP2374080.1 y4mF family transcriptional regulator [Paeniglutamicibacter psychrophenolicus]
MKTSPSLDAVHGVGAVVRDVRKKKRLTQAELAIKAHVSRTFVGELEKGHPGAELSKVIDVFSALGLSHIFGASIETPKPPKKPGPQARFRSKSRSGKRLAVSSGTMRQTAVPLTAALTQETLAKADDRLRFADAGLALAGHKVTDPVLRDIVKRSATQSLTPEEAIAAARRHVQG